jgi:hypothetical protein
MYKRKFEIEIIAMMMMLLFVASYINITPKSPEKRGPGAAQHRTYRPRPPGGGGSGGGRGRGGGGSETEGREETKEAASRGCSQRSNLLSVVGVDRHENRCWVTCEAEPHSGHKSSGVLRISFWND